MNADLLADIQEAASLAGLGHIYPAHLYPYPREAVLERWRGYDGEVFLDPDGRGFSAIGDGWLNGLYVRPEAWGTGVAGELHDRAVEALREAGAATARLWVLEANVRARRFYERRGWTPDGSTRVVEFPPHPLDVGYSLTVRPPAGVA
ncbi:MAG TPA: GNAT family N-acetyltransferase [Gaiellaceae bacterium]|nr:GNAT family N-acetyltransferase [Gaiellaceae bacterium]